MSKIIKLLILLALLTITQAATSDTLATNSDLSGFCADGGSSNTASNITVGSGALAFASVTNSFPSSCVTIDIDLSAASGITWTGFGSKVLTTGLNGLTDVILSITTIGQTGLDAELASIPTNVINLTISAPASSDITYPNLVSILASTSTIANLTLELGAYDDANADQALPKTIKGNSNITTVVWTSGNVGGCAEADIDTDSEWDNVIASCLPTNDTLATDSDLSGFCVAGSKTNTASDITVASGALAFASVTNSFPNTCKTIDIDLSAATGITWTGFGSKVLTTGLNGLTGVTLSITTIGQTGLDAELDSVTLATVINLTITAPASSDITYPKLAILLVATSSITNLTLDLEAHSDVAKESLFLAIKGNAVITTVTWTSGDVGICSETNIMTPVTWTSAALYSCIETALVDTSQSFSLTPNGGNLTSTCSTITSIDVVVPTIANYVLAEPTLTGTMTFANSDGSAFTGVAIETDDFALAQATLDKLTLGATYTLIWKPSYPDTGVHPTIASANNNSSIEKSFTFCSGTVTELKSSSSLSINESGKVCTSGSEAFTSVDIVAPTSADYFNVDTTTNVTFGGTWSLTNAKTGAVISTPAVPASGNISWDSTALGAMVVGTIYRVTFTPAYSGTGTAVNTFHLTNSALSGDINYCLTETTKKSTGTTGILIVNVAGNFTTGCDDITSINVTAPPNSDYFAVDETVGVNLTGTWSIMEGSNVVTFTSLSEANTNNSDTFTISRSEITDKFEKTKDYVFKWVPTYTGGTPAFTVANTEYFEKTLSFCPSSSSGEEPDTNKETTNS